MSQAAVCQTCGDSGFPEALNCCVKCGEAAEHTYCLKKLPKVLNQYISWTCESCISTTVGDSSEDTSADPLVRGPCIGIFRQKAPRPRRRKRRWSITYAAHLKMTRKNRCSLPCCMIDSADTISLQKVARQKEASPGSRKRGGRQPVWLQEYVGSLKVRSLRSYRGKI